MKPTVFFFVYLVSVMVFFIGLHNIDIAFNMLNLEKSYGLKLIDTGPFGIQQDSIQGYLSGLRFLLISNILGLISIAGIVILMELEENKH